MDRSRFSTSVPSHQTGMDLFKGEWVSDLSEILPGFAHSGTPLFKHDNRPRQAAAALGTNDRFDGMNVLELGPLEAGHSYQLESLGAKSVTAIEANADAFLRCLLIKNALSLSTTFYFGDCTRYLESHDSPFDLIFACGILYHMQDPVELIRLISLRTKKLFIWSQYYDADFVFYNGKKLPHRKQRYVGYDLDIDVYSHEYANRFRKGFLGGNKPSTNWLSLDGILMVLRRFGFLQIDIIEDDKKAGLGPAVTLAACRL